MLTVFEVAQRLGVSRGLVYKLINRGDMECHRVGSVIRVAESQLQGYLERTHSGGGTDPFAVTEFKHLKVEPA